MRPLKRIVVHHSGGSRASTVSDIEQTHRARGWPGIGYHFVITQDAVIHATKPMGVVGTHVLGHNSDSIGICVVGDNTQRGQEWTNDQIWAMRRCLKMILTAHPGLEVVGHKDLATTVCPGRDVAELLRLPMPKEVPMSAPTVPVTRAPSSPAVGGVRDTVKFAILTLLMKWGLPMEMSDTAASAVSGALAGALTFLGKMARNWLDTSAPSWLRFVGKFLPL